MSYIDLIKNIMLIFIICSNIFGQSATTVAPKQNPHPVQVTVSGNHPDAIKNQSTIIYDNTKNIDLRSYERPIKNTVPPSDTEEELFLPNEVIPVLSIEEMNLKSLPETQPSREQFSTINIDEKLITTTVPYEQNIIYTGTRKQNIQLMKALNIKSGWSKNKKWKDGTAIDNYSIVDWIRSGKGESFGINKKATSIDSRKILYYKHYLAGQ